MTSWSSRLLSDLKDAKYCIKWADLLYSTRLIPVPLDRMTSTTKRFSKSSIFRLCFGIVMFICISASITLAVFRYHEWEDFNETFPLALVGATLMAYGPFAGKAQLVAALAGVIRSLLLRLIFMIMGSKGELNFLDDILSAGDPKRCLLKGKYRDKFLILVSLTYKGYKFVYVCMVLVASMNTCTGCILFAYRSWVKENSGSLAVVETGIWCVWTIIWPIYLAFILVEFNLCPLVWFVYKKHLDLEIDQLLDYLNDQFFPQRPEFSDKMVYPPPLSPSSASKIIWFTTTYYRVVCRRIEIFNHFSRYVLMAFDSTGVYLVSSLAYATIISKNDWLRIIFAGCGVCCAVPTVIILFAAASLNSKNSELFQLCHAINRYHGNKLEQKERYALLNIIDDTGSPCDTRMTLTDVNGRQYDLIEFCEFLASIFSTFLLFTSFLTVVRE